jgi:hypothetical protein
MARRDRPVGVKVPNHQRENGLLFLLGRPISAWTKTQDSAVLHGYWSEQAD